MVTISDLVQILHLNRRNRSSNINSPNKLELLRVHNHTDLEKEACDVDFINTNAKSSTLVLDGKDESLAGTSSPQ